MNVLDAVQTVYDNYSRKIPTARLNDVMLPIVEETPPPAWKGKYVKIKYVTQLKATTTTTDEKNPEIVVSAPNVPSFAFFCNLPQWVKEPYRRYLENKIREKWDFSGTPINIFMREK